VGHRVSFFLTAAVTLVVDIRRYPSSRKFPHFNSEVLRKLLGEEDIRYLWLEALGGRRHGRTNCKSLNVGVSSLGFRNYADYMATCEFRTAVQALLSTAGISRIAIMCAEKFYWKCHRRLLSDYLVTQGVKVTHILGLDKLSDHKLTSPAVKAQMEQLPIHRLHPTKQRQKSFWS
jgi:uncharacterized protein (DUF488 family)